MIAEIHPLIVEQFPDLPGNRDAGFRRLFAEGKIISLDAGETIFRVGSKCQNFLIVLSGSVRVVLTSLTGRTLPCTESRLAVRAS